MPRKQWEVDAKDAFVAYLRDSLGQDYHVTGEDVPSNPDAGTNFDYELSAPSGDSPVVALEICRLVVQELNLGQSRTWCEVVDAVTTELEKRGIREYGIRTPRFHVRGFERSRFAAGVADFLTAAIADSQGKEEFSKDGYTIRRYPGLKRVVFTQSHGVFQTDPQAAAGTALDGLIPHKNEQLNALGRLRILLVLDAGFFPLEDADLRRHFSTRTQNDMGNIDRVYLMSKSKGVSLVFDRRVLTSYQNGDIPERSDGLRDLFLRFVEYRLASQDEQALVVVRKIDEHYCNLGILSVEGRDALISYGEALAERSEWDSVLWIIDKLKADSDPAYPSAMHDRMVQGEENILISSVRGRLCWLIQKVIVYGPPSLYSTMLDVVEAYALGPDFYIRSQACVPFCELAARRFAKLPGGERVMSDAVAYRVKAVALRMMRDAAGSSALLDSIGNVLLHLRLGASEEEAVEMLDALAFCKGRYGIYNRTAMLLYFSLFRKDHNERFGPFDASAFEAHLHSILLDANVRLRTSLVWQMAGEEDDGKAIPYSLVSPYLPSIAAGEYDTGVFFHLRRICTVYLPTHAGTLCPIVLEATRKCARYLAAAPETRSWQIFDLNEWIDLLQGACNKRDVVRGVTDVFEAMKDLTVCPTEKLFSVLSSCNSD